MMTSTFGSIVYSFFLDYLPQQKGLRPSSIRSYRDTLRLFLMFASAQTKRGVSELRFEDLAFERVLGFLRELEQTRRNGISTRNQRLAALHTFYEYVGRRVPEMLQVCGQVAAIPLKRSALPETRFMAREEVQTLFARLPDHGRLALRDRTLLLFLYNTGARVTEVANLKVEQLVLTAQPQVRLLGKGGKWRTCPLWEQTASCLATAACRARCQRSAGSCIHRRDRRAPDALRNLQAGTPACRKAREDAFGTTTAADHSARVPAHDRGPPARSRRRGQRDPRLAGTCESEHHQSLRARSRCG